MAFVSSISFLLQALLEEVKAVSCVFCPDREVKEGSVLPEVVVVVAVKMKRKLPRKRRTKSEVQGPVASLDTGFLDPW